MYDQMHKYLDENKTRFLDKIFEAIFYQNDDMIIKVFEEIYQEGYSEGYSDGGHDMENEIEENNWSTGE